MLLLLLDIEQTGMSSQFYDKFNVRYNISQVLKCIWNNTNHRKQVIKQSKYVDNSIHIIYIFI